MRLEPVNSWIVGHAIVSKMLGTIITPNAGAKGNTRCYLIESVSKEATDAGYNVGDIVVCKAVYDEFFRGGAIHRVTFLVSEVIHRVHDVTLDDFTLLDGNPLSTRLDLDGKPAEKTEKMEAAA